MNKLSKLSKINPVFLSGELYFQVLLEEGMRAGLLSEWEVEKIQAECIQYLAYKSERYTSGDSSSVRVELAQNILQSILYTIGIALKSLLPEDAILALKQTTIKSLYEKGRKKIDTKLKTAKHLHAMVLQNLIQTKNETYNATVIDGIKGFFKIYDADYTAHEIRITADYPLSNPTTDLVGIEFIVNYLKSILLENEFCNHFDSGRIHNLMRNYHEEYEILIINIYDQVLVSSIGCILAGMHPAELLIPKNTVVELQALWLFKTKQEIENLIFDAGHTLMNTLKICNIALKEYVRQSLSHISEMVYLAIQSLTLDKVLV